jgi:hypothetical protein
MRIRVQASLFNLFLGDVGEGVAHARYRLHCGVNDDGSLPGVLNLPSLVCCGFRAS